MNGVGGSALEAGGRFGSANIDNLLIGAIGAIASSSISTHNTFVSSILGLLKPGLNSLHLNFIDAVSVWQ
jgi:hypothetical protein